MKKYNALEKEIVQKYRARDWKKRKRMKVSGKSVFTLQRLITQPNKKKRH